MLPIRASAFVLAAFVLLGCSSRAPPAVPPPSPTVVAALPSAPTPRPPLPTPTPIPAPNVIGRVTPPATPTLRPGVTARLSLALDGPPSAAQVGLFVARERGYFLEAGLELFFHATPSRAAALAALGGERDQLGLLGADDVLRARAQGTPVVSLLALDGRGADGYGSVIATTDALRAAAGPSLEAFAKAAVRGYADVARDPGIAIDTLGRADSAFDRETAAREVGELVPFWRAAGPLGLQSEARWRDAHRRLVERGELAPTLDPAAAFTNELALAAAPTPTAVPSPTPRPTVPAPPARPTPRPAEPAPIKPAPSPTPADTAVQPPSQPPPTVTPAPRIATP